MKKTATDPKCVTDINKLEGLEGLPRERDTFWNKDTVPSPCTVKATSILRDRNRNKMSAFTIRERQVLGIHGRLPVGVLTLDQQLELNHNYLETVTDWLAKYQFLVRMEISNSTLFYALLAKYRNTYLAVFQLSATANLIKNFSKYYLHQMSIFITIKDRGNVLTVLRNWPRGHLVHILCVTSGEEVLAMGDQGVHGTPLVQFRRYSNVIDGGINPEYYLAVTMDVGTNNTELLEDPSYVGLRQKRCSAQEFDELFEEFTVAVLRLFGSRAIIQTKDFEIRRALRLLDTYRKRQCFMDLDMQSLGACGLAGVIAAGKITQLSFKENRFLFYGCSSFNIGMAKICLAYLKRMGLNQSEAMERIWFCDESGLLVYGRCGLPIEDYMLEFKHHHEVMPTLEEAIDSIRPNVLVGRGKVAGAFTKDVLRAMERSAKHPIIFAMSRPLDRAECNAEDAFVHTKGRCIFNSAIPLPDVKYGNKVYSPGYCVASYMTSGLTQGILLSGMTSVPDETFIVAADRLANMVWPTDLAKRYTYPPLRKTPCVNLQIADAVFSLAFRRRLATLWPEPKNYLDYLDSRWYKPQYYPAIPEIYCKDTWPIIATAESVQYYKHKI